MKKSVFVFVGSSLLVCTASLFAQTGTTDRPAQQEKPKAAEKAKTKATPEKAKAAEPPDSGTNKEMNKTDRAIPKDDWGHKEMNKTDRAPAKTAVKEKAAAKK
jgi:hypothetical protein